MNPAPFLFALLLAAATAFAAPKPLQTLEGKVVSIADGDTITVLDDTKTQHKVRLFGIDAPELRQPYSQLAKSELSKKVYAKRVLVKWREKDRYGRILGAVTVNGKNVNRELVAEGWAWHFVRYSSSKSLAEAELAAREKQVGLWAGEDPVAPWDWRKQEAERRAELTKRPPPEPAPPAEDVKVEAFVVRPRAAPLGANAASATVYVTATGTKYHRAGCRSLAKSSSPMPLAEAKARYSPCQLCNPPR